MKAAYVAQMKYQLLLIVAAAVLFFAPKHVHAQSAATWTPASSGYAGCTTTCPSAFAACTADAQANSDYVIRMLPAYSFPNEPYTCTTGGQYHPGTFILFATCPSGQSYDRNSGTCGLPAAAQPDKLIGPDGRPEPAPFCNCAADGVLLVGDPINVASGNVFYDMTDYQTAGPNKLSFTRYYNSRSPVLHNLGSNWITNFDATLVPNGSSQLRLARVGGKQLTFTLKSGVWVGDSDVDVAITQAGSNWQVKDKDDTVETYTTSTPTYLTSIERRNGYTQNLLYNNQGRLSTVTDSYGRVLTFTYNTDGTLASVSTPDNTTIAYGYTSTTGVPQLTSVTFPTSPTTAVSYVYEVSGRSNLLTGVFDENNGRFQTWSYDAYGRGLTSQVGNGSTANVTTVAYNDSTGARTVTNALGVTDTYTYAMLQGVPKVTGISRATTSTTAAASRFFSYDLNGYIASQTDWNGNSTTFVNNLYGLPTTINEAVGSSPSVARTTTIAYDPIWVRLPATITTPGLTTGLTYDASGNALTRVLTDTTTTSAPYSTRGQTRKWTLTYDSTGEPLSTQNPRGYKTFFTYANGTITQITDALNHSTNITSHTGGGRPLVIQDPNGVTTTMTYDQRQRPLTNALSTSAGTLTTSWAYSNKGDVTTTLPDGSFLTQILDSAHRVIAYADNYNNQKGWTLDASGNPKLYTLFDPSGNHTYWRNYVNDALGRRLQDKSQTTGAAYVYTYDNDGNPLSVTDPLGHATTQAYDPLNRLKSSTDANAGTFTVSYDARDRPITVTDKNGNATGLVYNGFGDVIQQASPDSGTTVFYYDADSNLTSKTDGSNVITNLSYDALDRPLTRTYPADATLNVAFTYDQPGHGKGIGRLTSLTDAVGSLSRTYDERGNVTATSRVSGKITYTTGFTFDRASRVATITYPSGSLVTYTRDSVGRVASVATKAPGAAASTPLASGITYAPYGPVTATTAFNGEKEAFTFDQDYRMLSLTTTAKNGPQHQTFSYDNADNLKTLTDTVCPSCSATYFYDVINRLTSASSWYGNYAYTFDKNGNFLTNNELMAATYNNTPGSNRITSITVGGSTYPTSYNGNGNMTSFTRYPGETTNLAYNKANELASTSGFGTAASYGYDAFRQRFSKTDNGSPATFYFYDQSGNTLEEIDGGTSYDYVWLDGRLIGALTPSTGTLAFVHGDKLGSPVDSTDKNGLISQFFSYSPYANTSAPYTQNGAQTITQNNRYPGQLFDPETLMNHNGYRDFSTSLGRYPEADPIGLRGGLNAYAYVRGKPLVATDPSGLADFMGVPPGLTSPPASAFPTTGFTLPPNVAVGGSYSVSSITPILSNGGGVSGINAECTLYQGCNLYLMYPANTSSFGFNPGWSLQCNAAIGGPNDDWSGVFNEYQGTLGNRGGGYFTVPEGQGDWQGLSYGIGGGTNIGASATQVIYKPLF